MEEFEKKQLENLGQIAGMEGEKERKGFLAKSAEELINAQKQMDTVILGGITLTDTQTYKTNYPIFSEIISSTFLTSLFKLIGVLGSENSASAPEAEGGMSFTGIVKSLASSITKQQNSQIVATFLPNEDIARLLKGLRDYEAVSNQNFSNPNQIAKHKIATDLYKDAFEIYLKILKDLYKKLNNNDAASNNELYKFYRDKYPSLMASVENHLRNDAGHLNYDEREQYTAEELMTKSNDVIAAIFTYVIAAANFYIDFYRATLSNYGVLR